MRVATYESAGSAVISVFGELDTECCSQRTHRQTVNLMTSETNKHQSFKFKGQSVTCELGHVRE